MKLAVLNSFYPPDNAITGQSAAALIRFLQRSARLDIRVYAGAGEYIQGSSGSECGVEVFRLGSSGRNHGKLWRLIRSLLLGRKMAREAVAWADVILSLTDPPLLGFWIGWYCRFSRRRVRWIEWTMDLFPEAFASAGIVTTRNAVYRLALWSVRRNPADVYVCLGQAQANAIMHIRANRPVVVLPCGIVPAPNADRWPRGVRTESRIVLAYAGNLGTAHCAELLPALVDAADPDRFTFVFALQGDHAGAVRSRLESCTNITWADYLSREDIASADVTIASLREQYTHICVPSKAVSSICLGRPILFAGQPQSDTWQMFADASWCIPVSRDGHYDLALLRAILSEIADPERRRVKEHRAREIGAALNRMELAGFEQVTKFVLNEQTEVEQGIQFQPPVDSVPTAT